jgi:hypothetical protein
MRDLKPQTERQYTNHMTREKKGERAKQNKHIYVHIHTAKVLSNQVKLVTNVLYIYIKNVTVVNAIY